MELEVLLLTFKEFFKDIVQYGFPTLAIAVSLLSFRDSKKANKIQERLHELEEKLKKYEIEEKEKEREEATKAAIEARIIRISKGNYQMKIWNSGKVTAYNVDFEVPQEVSGFIFKDKVPYEFLEPAKNFDEHVIVCSGMPSKFKVTTKWEDAEGEQYSKEQMVAI